MKYRFLEAAIEISSLLLLVNSPFECFESFVPGFFCSLDWAAVYATCYKLLTNLSPISWWFIPKKFPISFPVTMQSFTSLLPQRNFWELNSKHSLAPIPRVFFFNNLHFSLFYYLALSHFLYFKKMLLSFINR